jgi:hypothetical protein
MAGAGLAVDRRPGAMAPRDLRADWIRQRRREADELQAGVDDGEVVAGYAVCIGVVPVDATYLRSRGHRAAISATWQK